MEHPRWSFPVPQFRLRRLLLVVALVAISLPIAMYGCRLWRYRVAAHAYEKSALAVSAEMSPWMEQLNASEELYRREIAVSWSTEELRQANEDRAMRLRKMEGQWEGAISFGLRDDWSARDCALQDVKRVRALLRSADGGQVH